MKFFIALVLINTLIFSSPLYSKNLQELEEIINTILNEEKTNRPVKKNRHSNLKKNLKKGQITSEKNEKKLSPSSPAKALVETGIQFFDSGFYEKAKSSFKKIKQESPDQYGDIASIWLARIFIRTNEFGDAEKELDSIGTESGEYPSALFILGEVQIKRDRLEEAIEYFNKIASLFPGHSLGDDALLNLGRIYLDMGKGSQALGTTISLIKQYKNRETEDDGLYLLGKIFERDATLMDFSIARRIYKLFLKKAAIEKRPHFANSPLLQRVRKDLYKIEGSFFAFEK